MKNLFIKATLSACVLISSFALFGQKSSVKIPLSPTKTVTTNVKNVATPPIDASGPVNPANSCGPDFVRPVMWVHGHGGGGGSWDRASSATQNNQSPNVSGYKPRKVISHSMDYSSSSNSISSAASFLKTKLEGLDLNSEEKDCAVVIAHSLGGLVSSHVDYYYDTEGAQNRTFSGLVTVGTPHKGAVLAQNSYPYLGSMAEQFAEDACNQLSAGPVEDKLNGFGIDLLIGDKKITTLIDKACSTITSDLVTLVLSGFDKPIANDLKPNSFAINKLQNHKPLKTHRIAFYGVLQNDDMIWRTYHYMKNSPNAPSAFEADNAQESVDMMNENRDKYYRSKRDIWANSQNYWQNVMNWTCWNPGAIVVCLAATQ